MSAAEQRDGARNEDRAPSRVDLPATEAGRAMDLAWPGRHLDRLAWRELILAIEAQAQALAADRARRSEEQLHGHTIRRTVADGTQGMRRGE